MLTDAGDSALVKSETWQSAARWPHVATIFRTVLSRWRRRRLRRGLVVRLCVNYILLTSPQWRRRNVLP